MQVEVLADAEQARAYYEARYRGGYMDRWEEERRQRVLDVLRSIELPPNARILDYGCGSGAMTSVLAAQWPTATVVGVDVSEAAIAHATARQHDARIRFCRLDERFVAEHAANFDLVFSHHVLEHVFELDHAVRELTTLVVPGGQMLHALPCGNAGSLAHWLCQRRFGGIDAATGNRFYFEEASHLRRLRSEELVQRFRGEGAELVQAHFGYHWLGAFRLFTEMSPGALVPLLDPRHVPLRHWPSWCLVGFLLVLVTMLRAPAQVLIRARRVAQQVLVFRTRRLGEARTVCLLALVPFATLLLPISVPFEWGMRALDGREWRRRRSDPSGSEMLLHLRGTRDQPPLTSRRAAPPLAVAGRH